MTKKFSNKSAGDGEPKLLQPSLNQITQLYENSNDSAETSSSWNSMKYNCQLHVVKYGVLFQRIGRPCRAEYNVWNNIWNPIMYVYNI